MRPKPKHLGAEYGAQFQDASVVAAYPHRPPYPEAVFETLAGLTVAGNRAVLDLGCGTGDLARRLAEHVARVDAVDLSERMLALARTLPGGDRPNLRWILGTAEQAPLEPPYGLITAGESIHWMEWEIVLPRCRALLAPGAMLAIVARDELPQPWFAQLVQLIQQYTTNRDYQPYNTVHELTSRGLFTVRGQRTTAPVSFTQSIESYIESIHSRNGFSRERMAPEAAVAFDDGARALLARAYPSGQVSIEVRAHLTWGQP